MKDKFTAGFIAGVIGAIPMNAMNLFNYYVTHLAKLRYLDFSGQMIFGRLPGSIGEAVLAQLVQVGFSGVLGALFAFFLQWVTPKNSWFKGITWATGAWFVLYSISVLYKIPVISKPNLSTALWQYISTSIYGITMALTYVWLTGRVENGNDRGKTLKYRVLPAPSWKKRIKKKVQLRRPDRI